MSNCRMGSPRRPQDTRARYRYTPHTLRCYRCSCLSFPSLILDLTLPYYSVTRRQGFVNRYHDTKSIKIMILLVLDGSGSGLTGAGTWGRGEGSCSGHACSLAAYG